MDSFPADERRIQDVEQGLCHGAVVPIRPGVTLAVGDSILFALAQADPGREPRYVNGGDSVRVLLTAVDDLGEVDPKTGQPLFRLAWEPLGQVAPTPPPSSRSSRTRPPRDPGPVT